MLQKLLVISEEWTDHPRVQTSTTLNIFGIGHMDCEKEKVQPNRKTELWRCGKISLQISESPEKNGSCNKGKEWRLSALKNEYLYLMEQK